MANKRPMTQEQPREIPLTREQLSIPEQPNAVWPEAQNQTLVGVAKRPVAASLPAQQPSAPVSAQDPVVVNIEHVLSDGLADVYSTLDPITQRELKTQGETAAAQISTLLQQATVQVRKILQLITGWLKIIPGISRLFVEQEAKLKTDRLLALRRKMRGEE